MKEHAGKNLGDLARKIGAQARGDHAVRTGDPAHPVRLQPQRHDVRENVAPNEPLRRNCPRSRWILIEKGQDHNSDGFHSSKRRSCHGAARANVPTVAVWNDAQQTRPSYRRLSPYVLLALCVPLLLWLNFGCGGAQFNGTEYRDKDVAFRLGPVPLNMREVKTDDARVAFQNDQAGATVAIGARCDQESDDVPLQALVQHLFLQFEDRTILSTNEFSLDGRAALRTELKARLDGVWRHFVVVVMKKDNCVYDFLHVDGGGDSTTLRQSRADFSKMIEGFTVLH